MGGSTGNNLPYVGLVNEGSTCYLNSVIQALFHLPSFRQTLYLMEHIERDPVISALRRLFAQLHCGTRNVKTKELTDAFGWGDDDACVQHDVHEMMQKLFDRLEMICKGTAQENFVRDHFYGEITYITRIVDGVEYNAFRNEGFYDVELLVKHRKDIYESLDLWAEPERIENVSLEIKKGEPSTTHTVERSQRFARLPPVLLIHPNRAEFSMETFRVTTLPGKWEFPTILDLEAYMLPTQRDGGDIKILNFVYELRSIVIHQGVAHSGHFYTYVRLKDEWVCFNDIRVFTVQEDSVMASAFGGDAGLSWRRSNERASLLVYVRKDAAKEVLVDDVVPEHIRAIAREIEADRERLLREQDENVTFFFFTGEDSLADVLDGAVEAESKMRKITVSVLFSLEEVHAAIAREIGQTPDRIRVWEYSNIEFSSRAPISLHVDVRRCRNLFVEVLPEPKDVCCDETSEEPFFALVRFVNEESLGPCTIFHTRSKLAELMAAQEEQMRCFVCEHGPRFSEMPISRIPPGANLLICPYLIYEENVLDLLRQRKYKEVQILLLHRSCPGKWEDAGSLRVDENTYYSEMQKLVYNHLTRTKQLSLPSAEHIGFHRYESWAGGNPALGVCPMESGTFVNQRFVERFCGTESCRRLFVALLPAPLRSLDTQRLVVFNQGGGVRPVVYVEKRQYTLGSLYQLALEQVGSCLKAELVQHITRCLQKDICALRLIFLDQGRSHHVSLNVNENVLISRGVYVIDVLETVSAGFFRVDVVFCDRRSREECFGFPTNITLSDSCEETGADIAQRIAEKIVAPASSGEIERWIVAVRSRAGTCRTVGPKDVLKNCMKEIDGELGCIMVDRPRSLLLDGVGEVRQNSEQAIIIRNPSLQELKLASKRSGSREDVPSL